MQSFVHPTLKRDIWKGQFPILVVLEDKNVDPYVVLLSRMTYIGSEYPKILRWASVYLDEPPKLEDMWLEAHDGSVVKWWLPAGLVFDLMRCIERPVALWASIQGAYATVAQPPLRLRVRFGGAPKTYFPYSPELAQQLAIYAAKEASSILYGGANVNPVNQLSETNRMSMLYGILGVPPVGASPSSAVTLDDPAEAWLKLTDELMTTVADAEKRRKHTRGKLEQEADAARAQAAAAAAGRRPSTTTGEGMGASSSMVAPSAAQASDAGSDEEDDEATAPPPQIPGAVETKDSKPELVEQRELTAAEVERQKNLEEMTKLEQKVNQLAISVSQEPLPLVQLLPLAHFIPIRIFLAGFIPGKSDGSGEPVHIPSTPAADAAQASIQFDYRCLGHIPFFPSNDSSDQRQYAETELNSGSFTLEKLIKDAVPELYTRLRDVAALAADLQALQNQPPRLSIGSGNTPTTTGSTGGLSTLVIPPTPLMGAGTPATTRKLKPIDMSLAGLLRDAGIKVLIQGLEIPLETPLSWLYTHLRHPDWFLYIVLAKRIMNT